MNRQLPSDEKTLFILCEDIRQELGKKISLLGVFTGGNIIVQTTEESTTLPSVGFYFVFTDGEGDFDGGFQVIGPNGESVTSKTGMKFQKKPGESMVLMMKITPFKIENWGTYKISINLENEIFERAFDVKKGDIPPESSD